MTHLHNPESFLKALTPGEIGVIASTLDGCSGAGDAATVDTLEGVIWVEDIAGWPAAHDLAYHIVHDRQRDLI